MSRHPLPLFAYGTLRRGERHHALLKPALRQAAPALLPDHTLHIERVAYALPCTGRLVTGELLWLQPDGYDTVLARLDHLEGYTAGADDNHYERVPRTVLVVEAGALPLSAWVYLGGRLARERFRGLDAYGSGTR